MPARLRVLIIEDSDAGESSLRENLATAGFTEKVVRVSTESRLREYLTNEWDLVLVGPRSADTLGIRALEILKEAEIDVPLIVLSDSLAPDTAQSLFDNGVSNNVLIGHTGSLAFALHQALSIKRLRTESEAALNAARDTQARYEMLTGISRDVVFHIDAEGRFVELNPAFTEVTGWEIQEWIGRTFPAIVHPDDRAKGRSIFQRTLTGERIELFELRIAHKNGEFIISEFVVTRNAMQNGEPSLLGIGRDITERKRLESQSRQSQKMESLGALAGGIAHDFNNLIGIISGYCEMTIDSIEDDHPARRYLSQIDTAGQRAAALVQQILTFARKARISLEPIQLNKAVLDIFRMLLETFPKTVEISHDLEPGLPNIVADSSQINQILMNLCVNARDSMPSGGKLVIRTRAMPAAELPEAIRSPKHASYVSMSVSDTGVGMTDEVRNSIFDPFFSTKDTTHGSGLGLAVVHGIVKNHNAHILVDSKPDLGTTFEIFFPACSMESEASVPLSDKPDLTRGNETLLLVEDEPGIREMAMKTLKNNGYKVLVAEDGSEGVDLYRDHCSDIALVLLDLGLPKMDGIAVLERIRETDPGLNVILSSGYLAPDQEMSLNNDPHVHFLPKPYELKELLKMVNDTLNPPADQPS